MANRIIETCVEIGNSEIPVTINLDCEYDLDGDVIMSLKVETYGPIVRGDDYTPAVWRQIDITVEDILSNDGRLSQWIENMEFDSYEESFG